MTNGDVVEEPVRFDRLLRATSLGPHTAPAIERLAQLRPIVESRGAITRAV